MATVTLAEIMTRSRQKADMENSNFIEDQELLNYVNEAYYTWYDIMVEAYEDYYLPAEPVVFSLPSGTDGLFDLPADFYKLAGLDRSTSSAGTDRFYPMTKTPWRGRTNTENTFRYALTANVTYRIFKDKIQMTPKGSANGTYQLWYIPTVTPLADSEGEDTFESFNGFENLLIVDVAIKMLNKEESDPSLLMLERERLTAALNQMRIDRDINNGERIEEVYDSSQGYGPTGDFW